MEIIHHKITKSEIEYGIINLRKTDGTEKIFSELSSPFLMILKNKKLPNRKFKKKNIWIGFTPMEKFSPGDMAVIKKINNIVYVD